MSAQPSCEKFVVSTTYETRADPTSVAAGDLNHDGRADLAVAAGTSVDLLLQEENGLFSAQANDLFAMNPLVLADFNGDGYADIAGGASDRVRVSLSNRGTHGIPDSYWSDSPTALVAVDLDGDSDVDLAVTNGDTDSVSILLNDGTGTFASGVPYDVGTTPASLAAGDFDGDGDLDLVAGNSGAASVSVLRNAGNATFTITHQLLDGNAAGVAAGDFDADGDADVAASVASMDRVLVLLSHGDGTFEAAVHYPVGDAPGPVAATDFDGDGRADLAVVNRASGTFTLLFAGAAGTFAGATEYGAGNNPSAVTAADLNDDGLPDLAITAQGDAYVRLFFGVGGGVFTAYHETYPVDVIISDLNRDGHADFVTAGGFLQIRLGRGDGTFQPATSLDAGAYLWQVTSGDFNGDGIPDLAATGYTAVYTFLGSADGTFAPPASSTAIGQAHTMVAADFSGDGKDDLALAGSATADMSVMVSRGDGTFNAGINSAVGDGPENLAVGDFNADGRPDLAAAADQVYILINGGGGTFAPPVPYTSGVFARALITADFDRDAKLDLAVVDGSWTVSIFRGAGDGTFGTPRSYLVGTGYDAGALAATDVTGDGFLDLAIALDNYGLAPNLAIMTNRGDGTFDSVNATIFGHSQWTTDIAAADFDEDGAADLLLREQGEISVVFNRSQCTSATALSPVSGPQSGGQSVTITGTNLLGAASVTFGGIEGTITANTSTSIVVTTPPHAFGPVSVVVHAAGGKDSIVDAYSYELAPPLPPTGLIANAVTANRVTLSWNPVDGAASYVVERRSADASIVGIESNTPSAQDQTVEPGKAYLYRVRAVNALGTSEPGAPDLATTVIFTDSSLAGARVKAQHLLELRSAVDAVRLLAGQAPGAYTDDVSAPGVSIKAVHLAELRTILVNARQQLGLSAPGFSDATLKGIAIKAIHIQQLRDSTN